MANDYPSLLPVVLLTRFLILPPVPIVTRLAGTPASPKLLPVDLSLLFLKSAELFEDGLLSSETTLRLEVDFGGGGGAGEELKSRVDH